MGVGDVFGMIVAGAAMVDRITDGPEKRRAKSRVKQLEQEAVELQAARGPVVQSLRDFFAGDCPIIIDSNVWMEKSSEDVLNFFFDSVVRPSGKRMVMTGEQFAEIEKRKIQARADDKDPEATRARARQALRMIERQASKSYLKVGELLVQSAVRDFDSYALNSLIGPVLERGGKVILWTNDLPFRTRVYSKFSGKLASQILVLETAKLKEQLRLA